MQYSRLKIQELMPPGLNLGSATYHRWLEHVKPRSMPQCLHLEDRDNSNTYLMELKKLVN